MKALVKKKAESGLWLEDVRRPKVGVNDVLIKIHKTSICGTDVHIFNWDTWAQKTVKVPTIIGHEFVGSVEKIGANVDDVELGELVNGEGHVVCGRCRNCRAGRRHLCRDPKGIGVDRDGAFAEYISIPVSNEGTRAPHGSKSDQRGHREDIRSFILRRTADSRESIKNGSHCLQKNVRNCVAEWNDIRNFHPRSASFLTDGTSNGGNFHLKTSGN